MKQNIFVEWALWTITVTSSNTFDLKKEINTHDRCHSLIDIDWQPDS